MPRRKTPEEKSRQKSEDWISSYPFNWEGAHFVLKDAEGRLRWTISLKGRKAPARWIAQIIDFGDEYTVLRENRIVVNFDGKSVIVEEPALTRWLETDPGSFEFPERHDEIGSYAGRLFPRPSWWLRRREIDEQRERATERRATSKKSPKRTSGEPRAKSTRPKAPSDHVTVGAIAEQMKIDSRQARRALRASSVEKPAHGWSFPQSEVKSIIKSIKDNLK